MPEYNMVPGGTLSVVSRTVTAVSAGENAKIVLLSFEAGNQTSVQNAAGSITVSYTGSTLEGEGGFVQAFDIECPNDGLAYKGNQNDAEHIDVANIIATGSLIEIRTLPFYCNEHIGIADIGVSGTLTHINEL
jgi:hypothetical protein